MQTFKNQEEKLVYMTQTPIPRLVGTLAVPTVISMLITSLYNMADTYFVAKINTSATAAVGIVFPVMAIIQAVGFTFGHGSGNYISRALGRQDTESAKQMASTGFFSALFAGAVMMIVGILFQVPFARLLGATETSMPYVREYLSIILLGAPYMTASLVLNNQIRFQGSAFYSMIGITAGAVLNIILDPILILYFNMGVSGAAIATIFSQLVSFFLLLYGSRFGGNIRISWKEFKPCKSNYREILRGGMPSFWRQGLGSVATVCLNIAAGFYGDAAIAAMSIVNRITMFAASALIGFGQGFQPVCGFNYGAGLKQRVREAFYFSLKVAVVVLIVLAVIGGLFAPQIIGAFRKDDAEVVRIGAAALRWQCLTIPFVSWVILCNMLLQTIGIAGKATILAMARQGLFFLPAIIIFTFLFGITGIQISQPVADICSFLLALPMGLTILREFKES